MELYKFKARELKSLIDNKQVKVEEVIKAHIDRIKSIDDELGAFLYVAEEEALYNAKELDKRIAKGQKIKRLGGIPIGIKDNISVDGMQNTCASKILKGYISPYNAHVIEKLKENDAVIIGKLNMDEFAMGSSTESSAFKKTKNPWDIQRVPGGSSGGSVVSVSSSEVALSLGTETAGSVRQPASFCGVVGLKPTYGRISRYGVVALGSTLDQVGPVGRDVKDCALLTQCISGLDSRDFTTADVAVQDYSREITTDIRGKKIGVPKEFLGEWLDDEVAKAVNEAVLVLKSNGAEIKECSLSLAKYSLAAYYIISSAEASSNLARFDGIRYGYRTKKFDDIIDLYCKSRGEGFGPEVKRRIMLGAYVLSADNYETYYKKALKVRNLIKQDFEKVFREFDAIVSPTSPTIAFKFDERTEDIISMYHSDIYTVPANIAGLPAISLPCGLVNNMPVGLQLIGDYFNEDILFNIAYSYEQSTEWHKLSPNI